MMMMMMMMMIDDDDDDDDDDDGGGGGGRIIFVTAISAMKQHPGYDKWGTQCDQETDDCMLSHLEK